MHWYILILLLFQPVVVRLPRTASAVAHDSNPRDIVDLGYAKYLGNRTFPDTVAYLGIPYAEPPVGDLRFRATVPLDTERVKMETRGKVVDAREYPEFCVQGATSPTDRGGAGSEDCLKVNIWAPAGASKHSKLPVLVYIHGGAFVYGHPQNVPFDHWVHQSPDIVVVSIYYRLDAIGFLSHPSFANEYDTFGDLNAGFLDQIQALKWVQQNIGAFGGDKDRVTINGESAGGASVELHLVAREGEQGSERPLFSGAIAQSVYRTPLPLPQEQVPLFDKFAELAGCGDGEVGKKMACLRSASLSALAIAQDQASNSSLPYKEFHPVVDGTVITDYPTRLFNQGEFAKVPLVVGSTSNETLSGGTIQAALKDFFPALNEQDLDNFVRLYQDEPISSGADVFRTATGESELKCATTIMGTAFSKVTKAWTYRYNQPVPTGNDDAVEHAAENWMMFHGVSTGPNGTFTFSSMTPTENNFAAELIAYWISFIRSGNPNTFRLDQSPLWEGYSSEERNRIVLQQGTATESGSFMEQEPSDETRRCVVVAASVEHQQN